MNQTKKHLFETRKFVSALTLTAGALLFSAVVPSAHAGATIKPVAVVSVQSTVGSRITEKIDETKRVALTGHVRNFLKGATDLGSADGSRQAGSLMLLLSRTAKQQADLDAYVDAAHNKHSSNYHKWLTPAEFGARFQPADSDVATVKAWLVSKGLTVLDVVPSKTFISFTGTFAQLKNAFHVDIHNVTINGESHVATVTEPEIPLALASVIGGINKLDDFGPKPLVKPFGAFTKNLKTGKITPVKGTKVGPVAAVDGSESGSPFYEMGPQDFYTIYNENPLLSAGITGAGQTIAVIEEVQVAPADVTSFRSVFGLPTYPATPNNTQGGVNYMIGNSTSGLGGYASCFAPVTQAAGATSGEESEADIDLQWAGAVAPAATIDFVACGGTKTSGDGRTLGSLGIDHAAQYVVNYLSSTVVAASMSYGECEADMNSTSMAYYNGQWEQFAAEGITGIVSSGDGGAEQCYQNDANATTLPPSVNGFGSSAYNVSAGGTDFGDLYESNGYATTPVTTWWNPTDGPGEGSAVGYIAETTWAGYCSSEMFASFLQAGASTTFGTTYTPEGICSNATALADGYVAVVGGAGGISTYNAIPTWQSVYGVGLNSVSTTKRNIPDVSLFASNGFWGHFMPYCESDSGTPCTVADFQEGDMGAGGTSYVAPQLAGLMALISQQTGSRQGQADYTFYNLAAQEYGTTTTPAASLTSCSGSGVAPGARPPSSCYFYDISNDMPSLQGGTLTAGIYQPCKAGDLDCFSGNGGSTYGVDVVPGTTVSSGILGYTVSPGYDDATGLGSLNIYGTVTGWNTVTPTFASTTSLAASTNVVAASGSVTLTAAVTATGRGSTVAPAGAVEFFNGPTNLGSASITPACTGTGAATTCTGVASLLVYGSALTAGSDSITAYFEGDGANDAPSTSGPQVVKAYSYPVGNLDTVVGAASLSKTIPQSDSVYISGWAADPTDGAPVTSTTIYVDGVSVGAPTLGIARSDVASFYSNSSYTNSGFVLVLPASGLSVGTHTVTFTSTNAGGGSSTFGPVTITVTAALKPPTGSLDLAVDDHTATSTVSQADMLYAQGWAADYQANGAVASVHILVDGNPFALATLGVARPDVASYFSNPNWANTGFVSVTSASSLSLGTHSVTAYAVDHTGLVQYFQTYTITVVP